MAPNSSTSSSSVRGNGTRLSALVLGAVAVLWGVYLGVAGPIARWAGTRFSDAILALGKGRIVDPVVFVQNRGADSVLLVTLIALLALALWFAHRFVMARFDRTWTWLPLSGAWLLALNVFLLGASKTAMWWLVLHAAHPNLQLTAFHIERILAEEGDRTARVVVLGSSQGQSEISSGDLTTYGAPEVQTANLSYAGATAADFPLMREHYQTLDPEVLLIYLSPINLYAGASATRWTPLLTPNSLGYVSERGAMPLVETPRKLQGLLGLGIPMVKQSRALQHAVFGTVSEQGYFRPGFGAGLEIEVAKYTPEPVAAGFQEDILIDFLTEEAEAGRFALVIDGMVHPILEQALDPAVMDAYRATIERVRGLHENIVVVKDELPSHPPADYLDLYHISPEVRTEYTKDVADVLSRRLGVPMQLPGAGDSP